MVFFPGGWLPLLILAPQGFILTVWVQLCWLTPAACFSPLTSPCTTVFATAATENYFSPRVRGFKSAPEIFSECKFKIALTGEFLAEPVATSSIRVVSVLVVLTATHNPAGTSYQVYSLGCCSRQGGILGGYHRKSIIHIIIHAAPLVAVCATTDVDGTCSSRPSVLGTVSAPESA